MEIQGTVVGWADRGDFNTYVLTEVRKRKVDFQGFLRTACANALTKEARRAASGEIPPAIEASEVKEEQFTEYIKTLRRERQQLYKLIRSFLDLPPAPLKNMADSLLDTLIASSGTIQGSDLSFSNSPYAGSGPPKTHPSAGLAYSRTSQTLYNHPVWDLRGTSHRSNPVSSCPKKLQRAASHLL